VFHPSKFQALIFVMKSATGTVVRISPRTMMVTTTATVLALLVSPAFGAGSVVSNRRHLGARGVTVKVAQRPQDLESPPQDAAQEEDEQNRMLKRNKGGKSKSPKNCCDIIKKVLELDKACKSVVASAEKAIVCEEEFSTVSKGKKGSSSSTPEEQLDAAFTAFDAFIVSFQNGEFVVTQDDCFPDTAISPITLTTFGDWCVSASFVDGVIDYAPDGPIDDLGDYILNY
jgi:hypothetical protein